jgi:hypothetical protein
MNQASRPPRRFGAGIAEEPRALSAPTPPRPPIAPPEAPAPADGGTPAGEKKGAIEWRVEGVVEGYRTTAVFKCPPADIRAAVRRLAERGLDRPAPRAADGTALCPKHLEPLRVRKEGAREWASHAIKDEHGVIHYCSGHPGSAGWMVPAAEGGAS